MRGVPLHRFAHLGDRPHAGCTVERVEVRPATGEETAAAIAWRDSKGPGRTCLLLHGVRIVLVFGFGPVHANECPIGESVVGSINSLG